MNLNAIQWIFRLPSLLGACLGAGRIGFIGVLVVFLLSVPFVTEAQQAAPAPTDTVQELEDLAAVMEDKAAREYGEVLSAPNPKQIAVEQGEMPDGTDGHHAIDDSE